MEASDINYAWRAPVSSDEMIDLIRGHTGSVEPGWWSRVRPHSLGWVTARTSDGLLVGFVNVAWDGGDHAFLLDTKTRATHQRQGIATTVVQHAVQHARDAGCDWLHVDFEDHLARFYFEACGFKPTKAGLIRLRLGSSS